jgi:hypothetical protein
LIIFCPKTVLRTRVKFRAPFCASSYIGLSGGTLETKLVERTHGPPKAVKASTGLTLVVELKRRPQVELQLSSVPEAEISSSSSRKSMYLVLSGHLPIQKRQTQHCKALNTAANR